jgi:hypothetical protein
MADSSMGIEVLRDFEGVGKCPTRDEKISGTGI